MCMFMFVSYIWGEWELWGGRGTLQGEYILGKGILAKIYLFSKIYICLSRFQAGSKKKVFIEALHEPLHWW